MRSSEMSQERAGLVPADVRAQVIDRDNSCCRVCGRYVEVPALHHIRYRSQGGLDAVDNLITVGWSWGHDCHLTVVHADKRVWQPILLAIVEYPHVTALAYRRWMLTPHEQDLLRL